ncbi:MAG: plastocyanin/azurin family copper-binding protein [Actinobacteria bacterium]|nr:plastocyanin/azurin family copper-binding protein [Actinomycetota bacterium]
MQIGWNQWTRRVCNRQIADTTSGSKLSIRTLLATLGTLLLCSLLLTACGAVPAGPASAGPVAKSSFNGPIGAKVIINYVSFEPAKVVIKTGQTVEWIWHDTTPYTPYNVVFYEPGHPGKIAFQSRIAFHGSYYHTFNHPGIYPYRCTLHQRMSGVVVVR